MKFLNAKNSSLLSALATSACCLPALILLVFSVGSATLGATLASYHWWFLAVGAALLGVSYYLFFKEKRACSTQGCAMQNRKFTITSLLFGTLVVGAFAANSFIPLVFAGNSQLADDAQAQAAAKAEGLESATFPVEGMTCFSCELHVQKVLKDVAGVERVNADTGTQSTRVTFDPRKTTLEQLVEAINTKTGYKASLTDVEQKTKVNKIFPGDDNK